VTKKVKALAARAKRKKANHHFTFMFDRIFLSLNSTRYVGYPIFPVLKRFPLIVENCDTREKTFCPLLINSA